MSDSNQVTVTDQTNNSSILYVEECVLDQNGFVIFLNVWGAKSAVDNLLSRLILNIGGSELLSPFNLIFDKNKFPVFSNCWAKRTTATFGMEGLYV